MFVNVTRPEIDSCFYFAVVDGAVTFLNNTMFSLVWFELLVVVARGFKFGVSSWIFWLVGCWRESSGRFMITYIDLAL